MSLRFIDTAPAEGACRLKCTQIENRQARLLYRANIPLAAPSCALDVEGDHVSGHTGNSPTYCFDQTQRNNLVKEKDRDRNSCQSAA